MQEQRGAERLATEQHAVTAGHGQSLQDRSRMTLPNNGGETPTACHTASARDAQRRGQSPQKRLKVLLPSAGSLSREEASGSLFPLRCLVPQRDKSKPPSIGTFYSSIGRGPFAYFIVRAVCSEFILFSFCGRLRMRPRHQQ